MRAAGVGRCSSQRYECLLSGTSTGRSGSLYASCIVRPTEANAARGRRALAGQKETVILARRWTFERRFLLAHRPVRYWSAIEEGMRSTGSETAPSNFRDRRLLVKVKLSRPPQARVEPVRTSAHTRLCRMALRLRPLSPVRPIVPHGHQLLLSDRV